jgi:hypothetical protein
VGPAAPRAASSSGLLAALTHQYAAPPVCHAAECRGRPPPPTYPTACHAVTRESRPLCVFAPVFCFLPRLAAPARGRGAHARPQPQPQGSGACSTFRTLPPTFASWLSLSLSLSSRPAAAPSSAAHRPSCHTIPFRRVAAWTRVRVLRLQLAACLTGRSPSLRSLIPLSSGFPSLHSSIPLYKGTFPIPSLVCLSCSGRPEPWNGGTGPRPPPRRRRRRGAKVVNRLGTSR